MSPRKVEDPVLADARSASPTPILLVQIQTGKPATPYLRFTNRDHDIEFGGETFSRRPLELDDTTLDSHTETGGPRLRTMDLDETFADLIDEGYDFHFKRVRIWRSYSGAIGGAEQGMVDDWFVDFYERVAGAISFSLKPMVVAFSQKIPLRTLSRDLFVGIPDPD